MSRWLSDPGAKADCVKSITCATQPNLHNVVFPTNVLHFVWFYNVSDYKIICGSQKMKEEQLYSWMYYLPLF
jgi:hypothetical protein